MRHYRQHAQEQPYQIHALLKAGHSQTEIATIIAVHKTNISRKLRLNCGLKHYRPKQAHQQTQHESLNRRQDKATPRLIAQHWHPVEQLLLREDWSPGQISLWLAQEEKTQVSHQ